MDRYLLESSTVDGYLLEDGTGVLLLQPVPAVARVQHLGNTSNGTAATTSTVITVASLTVTLGNTIIVGAAFLTIAAGTPSAVDNLGNVYTADENVSGSNRTNTIFSAPVTVAGVLTSITLTHLSATYKTLAASEFSGVGTFATVGGGAFFTAVTTQTWDNNKTIPANGAAFGFMQTDSATTPVAGAASGNPTTATVLDTYRGDGPNISGSLWYALAGTDAVTTFSGTSTTPSAVQGATAGANYNAKVTGTTATPGVASLVLATFAPTVTTPQTVTPGVASLTLATFAPAAIVGTILVPTTASLSLVTFAPTVTASDNKTATAGVASLTLTTFAPSVAATANQVVTPGVTSLTLTAFAPTATATNHQTATPGVASLTLTTFAPTVTAGSSNNITVTPTTASLALTAFAPNITASDHKLVTPATLALVTQGFAPTVSTTSNVLVTPGPLGLTLTTYEPTVTGSDVPGSARKGGPALSRRRFIAPPDPDADEAYVGVLLL